MAALTLTCATAATDNDAVEDYGFQSPNALLWVTVIYGWWAFLGGVSGAATYSLLGRWPALLLLFGFLFVPLRTLHAEMGDLPVRAAFPMYGQFAAFGLTYTAVLFGRRPQGNRWLWPAPPEHKGGNQHNLPR